MKVSVSKLGLKKLKDLSLDNYHTKRGKSDRHGASRTNNLPYQDQEQSPNVEDQHFVKGRPNLKVRISLDPQKYAILKQKAHDNILSPKFAQRPRRKSFLINRSYNSLNKRGSRGGGRRTSEKQIFTSKIFPPRINVLDNINKDVYPPNSPTNLDNKSKNSIFQVNTITQYKQEMSSAKKTFKSQYLINKIDKISSDISQQIKISKFFKKMNRNSNLGADSSSRSPKSLLRMDQTMTRLNFGFLSRTRTAQSGIQNGLDRDISRSIKKLHKMKKLKFINERNGECSRRVKRGVEVKQSRNTERKERVINDIFKSSSRIHSRFKEVVQESQRRVEVEDGGGPRLKTSGGRGVSLQSGSLDRREGGSNQDFFSRKSRVTSRVDSSSDYSQKHYNKAYQSQGLGSSARKKYFERSDIITVHDKRRMQDQIYNYLSWTKK